MAVGTTFSGEPLPVAPRESNVERASFDRKILDYLRRLGAKLEYFANNPTTPPAGGGGSVEAMSLFFDADQAVSTSGTLGTAISWNRVLWKDSPFGHSGATSQVLLDGFYLVHVDLELYDLGFINSSVYFVIVDDLGAPLRVPIFGDGIFTSTTYHMSIGLPMRAFTRFSIFLKTSLNDAGGLRARACRMNVLRLRDNVNGGDSDSPGQGWDVPDGQYPDWTRVAEL